MGLSFVEVVDSPHHKGKEEKYANVYVELVIQMVVCEDGQGLMHDLLLSSRNYIFLRSDSRKDLNRRKEEEVEPCEADYPSQVVGRLVPKCQEFPGDEHGGTEQMLAEEGEEPDAEVLAKIHGEVQVQQIAS